MAMSREKRIHLLRQFSILLPPFSPKQGQPHVPLGQHTGFVPACARQNTSISSITPALPALLCRAGGENKFLQGFVQVGLEMMAPMPLPSWNRHSSTPYQELTSLDPLCIQTKLPPTSKQLLFFMPLLYKSAFLVLWSRDREKWDGSQLKFAGTLCDLLQVTEVCTGLAIIFYQHWHFLFPRERFFIGGTNFFHKTTLSCPYYGQH